MINLFRFLSQFLLLFIFILLININVNAAVNYKLTSIFYGGEGQSMGQVDNLTLWTGKHIATNVMFTDWCPGSMDTVFNDHFSNMWNNKTIPVLTWQMNKCGGQGIPGVTKLVYNNTFDDYLNTFSDRLKSWLSGSDGIYGTNDDKRIYMRLAHEMNGNWYAWSKNSTPNDYVLAWRHVYDLFAKKGLDSTRVQWIWCVNNNDVGEYKAEEYYVGDNYIDWIGIDGYNFGKSASWSNWIWPKQVFDGMIARVRNLSASKPISFNEYGCTSVVSQGVSDVKQKTEWLNQFCDYINQNQIKMASYFNIEKETDWAIFGGSRGDAVWNGINVYTAYKDCLQSNDWIQPNSSNPRLITDDQFAGKF